MIKQCPNCFSIVPVSNNTCLHCDQVFANVEQDIIDNAPCDDWESFCNDEYFKNGDYGVRYHNGDHWDVISDENLGANGRLRKDIEFIANVKSNGNYTLPEGDSNNDR